MSNDDRRATQRIRLFTPVTASTEEGAVLLLDLSGSGARIEHRFALRVGTNITLYLQYEQTDIRIAGSVVRCRMQQSKKRITYVSAVQFATADETLVDSVRTLIKEIIGEDLPARVTYAK